MMRDIMAEGDQLAEFRSPSRWFASMRDPPSALGKRERRTANADRACCNLAAGAGGGY
jgi:hypothetical protein